MQKLKLSYFDFDGGRGEAIRLALMIGGVSFEDNRLSMEQFAAEKSQYRFQAVPVLHVDGKPLAQSGAICRFVGKLTDLYPADPWHAAVCDEVLETVEEMTVHVGSTIRLNDEEKKAQREVLAKETLPVFLKGLEQRVASDDKGYVCTGRLTVADLKLHDLVNWLRMGILDHIPQNLVDSVAPKLVQHYERVKSHPKIQAYYASREKKS
jgi:prostaglandin-H2 D-isomerase / glutathione transferase